MAIAAHAIRFAGDGQGAARAAMPVAVLDARGLINAGVPYAAGLEG